MRFSNVQGSGEWDQESWSLLLDRYSKATMNVYRSQYRWWQLFCRRRGIDPVRYVTHYDRQEENLFLEYNGALLGERTKSPGNGQNPYGGVSKHPPVHGVARPHCTSPADPLGYGGDQKALQNKSPKKAGHPRDAPMDWPPG